MNIDIEKVLEKYYAGTTSLEEEKILRDFFACENLNENYLAEKFLFESFCEERQQKDTSGVELFPKSIQKSRKNSLNRNKWMYFSSGVAACLVFSIGIIFYQNEQNNAAYVVINGVRINDKELAIGLVNENLSKISAIMDRGLAPIDKVKKTENKLDSILYSINY